MITLKRADSLEYETAQGIRVPHGFTTRLGGVSRGHLASLNIGTSRGDAPENVLENYARLGSALGFDIHNLVLSRQVHSDIVYTAEAKDAGAGLFAPPLGSCDALITCTPGLALVVFTADCTPILLWDEKTGAVGAIHAGWRGTVSGIAGKAVAQIAREFGSRPEDIHAAIGPNIGFCHFETDEDVPQAFRAAYGEATEPWIAREGGKYRLDLKQINRWILNQAGVTRVEVSESCTVCQCDRFWSYRVCGTQRGSQGAVIVCQKEAP